MAKKKEKSLNEICFDIGKIQSRIASGRIAFVYDNLMAAIKPGHPADILEEILSPVATPIFFGEETTEENVRKLLEQLKAFAATFQIAQLQKPIQELEAYIERTFSK